MEHIGSSTISRLFHFIVHVVFAAFFDEIRANVRWLELRLVSDASVTDIYENAVIRFEGRQFHFVPSIELLLHLSVRDALCCAGRTLAAVDLETNFINRSIEVAVSRIGIQRNR